MKEYRICLTPRSGFEITLHSDTLFGAICWGIRTLFGEAKLLSVLEEFKTCPPFLLSSALPWKGVGEKRTWYLPKPFLRPLVTTDFKKLVDKARKGLEPYHVPEKVPDMDLATKYKRFKKLKWIPADTFRKVLKGGSEKDLFIDYLDRFIGDLRFDQSGITQKNSLDRLAQSTTGVGETFYTIDIGFRENHGLYFLLKTADIDVYLTPVLMLLQDSGIGPNARTGRNWFTVDIEKKPLFDTIQGRSFITLSRYICSDSIDADASWYQLASVRSKVESRQEFAGEDVWKDRVTYLSAGSLVKPKDRKEFYGGLVPVKEIAGKTVYQYGYAYPVWLEGGNHGV
ncbi:MAG: type III-A CRISPR-associated RAMP protein Csm4 [Deltaproteobacteria bacterium RBG_16_47_11]|nr:MAG: type III-A CRISPR-associated RAMP protein Csm4 [Deltaproteobacteria bacterium RBG_16_47_11]